VIPEFAEGSAEESSDCDLAGAAIAARAAVTNTRSMDNLIVSPFISIAHHGHEVRGPRTAAPYRYTHGDRFRMQAFKDGHICTPSQVACAPAMAAPDNRGEIDPMAANGLRSKCPKEHSLCSCDERTIQETKCFYGSAR
jgi:hypothetical protein